MIFCIISQVYNLKMWFLRKKNDFAIEYHEIDTGKKVRILENFLTKSSSPCSIITKYTFTFSVTSKKVVTEYHFLLRSIIFCYGVS